MAFSSWKKTGIILLVISALLLTAAYYLPGLLQPDRYRTSIINKIEQATGGQAAFDSITWRIDNGLWVKITGFSLQDVPEFPADLLLSEVELKLELRPLFSKQIIINRLDIHAPWISLHLTEQMLADDETKSYSDSDTALLPYSIIIQSLNLTRGELNILDSLSTPGKNIVSTLKKMDITSRDLMPGDSIDFDFTFQAHSVEQIGEISGHGQFDGLTEALLLDKPQLNLSTHVKDLPVAFFNAYLGEEAANKLNGSISFNMDYQGDFEQRYNAAGVFDLSALSYSETQLWEHPLPGLATNIGYQVNISGDTLDIDKLDIKLGELSLSAKGSIHDWHNDPVLTDTTVSGQTPLAVLDYILPWKIIPYADEIRDRVHRTGHFTLEKLTLPETNLNRLIDEPALLLTLLQGSGRLQDAAITTPLDIH